VARSGAQRSSAYRARLRCGLDLCSVEIDRQAVLAANVMTPDEYSDPQERQRLLSELIDEILQSRSFAA
jgi:hypothetical protein